MSDKENELITNEAISALSEEDKEEVKKNKAVVAALESCYAKAKEILDDKNRVEAFLKQVEDKIKKVPKYGENLSQAVILLQILYSYYLGEYTDLSKTKLIIIIAGLIYLVTPFDAIPDNIPVVGHLDDIAVLSIVYILVGTEIDTYKKWRKENHKD